MDPVLVHLGCRNRNTIDCVAYQQKFVSYSLEAGKSKVKVSAPSVSGESLLPGPQVAAFLLCPQKGQGSPVGPLL